jgi:predicted nucleic acid-binding protein
MSCSMPCGDSLTRTERSCWKGSFARTWNGAFVAETEAWPVAICDAGPLIHLAELGCLDLLQDFQALLIPEQVREEVARHRPDALAASGLPARYVPVEASTDPRFKALVKAFSLDSGEQAALSLMDQVSNALFLTDDAAARLAAKALGFRSQGSLGVLLRALRLGRRTKAAVLAALRDIPSRSTLHIRANLLNEVIKEVERSEG